MSGTNSVFNINDIMGRPTPKFMDSFNAAPTNAANWNTGNTAPGAINGNTPFSLGDSGYSGFMDNPGSYGSYATNVPNMPETIMPGGGEGINWGDTLKGVGSVMGGVGGIWGASNAHEQNKIMKDMYGKQHQLAMTNLHNQGTLLNDQILAREKSRLNNRYSHDDSDEAVAINDAQAAENVKDKYVKTTV